MCFWYLHLFCIKSYRTVCWNWLDVAQSYLETFPPAATVLMMNSCWNCSESSLNHWIVVSSLQTLSGWWMGLVCAQADWRWRLTSPTSPTSRGPQCVKLTLTSRMQRWSVGSLAVGLLQSSRGWSMEKWRIQCGPKSSSVEEMSLLSWTVEAQTQRETPAHLAKLLDSPAQVEEELQLWSGSFLF